MLHSQLPTVKLGDTIDLKLYGIKDSYEVSRFFNIELNRSNKPAFYSKPDKTNQAGDYESLEEL